MGIYEKLMQIYPSLKPIDFINGTIILQNDMDGKGDYIKSWNHSEYAQPTEEQLKGVK
jgi:hypothetical protein